MNTMEFNHWREIKNMELVNLAFPPRNEVNEILYNLRLTTKIQSYENRWGEYLRLEGVVIE